MGGSSVDLSSEVHLTTGCMVNSLNPDEGSSLLRAAEGNKDACPVTQSVKPPSATTNFRQGP